MITGWRKHLRRWHPEGIPWPASVLYNAISRSWVFTRHYQLVADDLARYCRRGRVLHIGTGPGWLLPALRRSLPEVEALGVDISAAMVTVARNNLARAGCPDAVEVQLGGAETLPFPDGALENPHA